MILSLIAGSQCTSSATRSRTWAVLGCATTSTPSLGRATRASPTTPSKRQVWLVFILFLLIFFVMSLMTVLIMPFLTFFILSLLTLFIMFFLTFFILSSLTPSTDCAWCNKNGWQCEQNAITGPDSKKGSRCQASGCFINSPEFCQKEFPTFRDEPEVLRVPARRLQAYRLL